METRGRGAADHGRLHRAIEASVATETRQQELAQIGKTMAEVIREEEMKEGDIRSKRETLLRLLEARGIPFRRLRPGPYAGRLRGAVRDREPGRLVDTMLSCALIEARSCERFQLLAKAVEDPELAAFYGALLEAEARHHGIYVDLASRVGGDAVRERLQELAAAEAEIVSTPPVLPRMHG